MINFTKSITISDVIHNTITCSGIEGEVIKTPIFNRLHRVSQSSLVFLTFASNKVKRFEHSIGTMYLAGEIFYNSVCNANEEALYSFLKDIKEEIKLWREQIRYDMLPKKLQYIKGEKILKESSYPSNNVYSNHIPAFITKEYGFLYLIAFQAIRLAGLLHDVGHLPYSHILEKSLKKLNEKVKHSPDNEIKSEIREYFLKVMGNFVENNERENNFKIDEIHEEFGKLLVNNIKQEIISNLSYEQKNSMDYFFILLSFDFASKILNSNFYDNNIFSDLHLIISSVVDADRMDYTSRDLYCSGVDKNILNYNRLIQSYKLIHKNIDNKSNTKSYSHYLFCPAEKNLTLINELLTKRYKIFSNINYHHRVHKHEIILEEIICELGWLELKSKDVHSLIKEDLDPVLPMKVSSIWKLVNEIKTQTTQMEYQLIQLDDSWLDTLLKHKFFELYPYGYLYSSQCLNDIQWHQLCELISAKKYYVSLIKRSNDFRHIDKIFFDKFKDKKLKSNDLDNFPLYSNYTDFVNKNRSFFFNEVIFHIKKLAVEGQIENYYNLIEKEMNSKLKDLPIQHCIIRSCRFGNGLNTIKYPMYLNDDSGNEIPLEQLSPLRSKFKDEEKLTPPFHFYYLPEYDPGDIIKEISQNDKEKIIDMLVNHLLLFIIYYNTEEYYKNNKINEENPTLQLTNTINKIYTEP